VADTRNDLGNLLSVTGRPSAAEDEFQAARALNQKLADDNPTFAGYRHALASSHANVADVLRNLGRNAEARQSYEKAIAIREALVGANTETTAYRSNLASNVRRRGLVRLASGETAAAIADARRAIALYEGLPSRSADDSYEMACCHAMLAAAPTDDAGAATGNGESEADKTMTLLRLAVLSGFRNHDAMTRETALDSLRNRPDFRLMVMDLAMPVDPFARAGD
jgi:tetratricopeptide (TPR) repeat protein